MTRTPFDQFSKLYLDGLFASRGEVEISREVPGESLAIDVFFQPAPPSLAQPQPSTLLDKIARTPCLLEPYRNPPPAAEIRKCLQKLYWMHGEWERISKRKKQMPFYS